MPSEDTSDKRSADLRDLEAALKTALETAQQIRANQGRSEGGRVLAILTTDIEKCFVFAAHFNQNGLPE